MTNRTSLRTKGSAGSNLDRTYPYTGPHYLHSLETECSPKRRLSNRSIQSKSTTPSTNNRKRLRSELDEISADLSTNYPQNKEDCIHTALDQGLRSTQKKPRKNRRERISFSPRDEIIEYDHRDIRPLVQVQDEYRIYERPSLAVQGAVQDAIKQDRKMKEACAYGQVYDFPTKNNDDEAVIAAEQLRISSSVKSIGRSVGTEHVGQDKKPETPPKARAPANDVPAVKPHHHWHGYPDCQHGFSDPMNCICSDPTKKIWIEKACIDCVRISLDKATLEKEKKEKKGKGGGGGWLKKLGL